MPIRRRRSSATTARPRSRASVTESTAPAVLLGMASNAAALGAGSGTCALASGAIDATASIAAQPRLGASPTCVREAKADDGDDVQGRSGRTSSTPTPPRRRLPPDGQEPRTEGDPADRRLRDRALRRPAVPGRARSTSPTASTTPTAHRRPAREQDQRRRQPGLDVQPLPGDVLRAAVPARRRCPRPGSRQRGLDLRARLPVHDQRAPAAGTCHGTTSIADDAWTPRSTRSGSTTAGTSCRATPTTTATTHGLGAGRRAAGVGALQDIDSACGPTGKAVYDAAQIADPEIDYYRLRHRQGRRRRLLHDGLPRPGGNGDSQINGVPPYDNIWPHSVEPRVRLHRRATARRATSPTTSSHDLEGRAAVLDRRYARTQDDDGRRRRTRSTCASGRTTSTPRSAIEHASVISHEYGHSLGLPDYYSTGSRDDLRRAGR